MKAQPSQRNKELCQELRSAKTDACRSKSCNNDAPLTDDINSRIEEARPTKDKNVGNVTPMEVTHSHEAQETRVGPLCRKGKAVSPNNIEGGLTLHDMGRIMSKRPRENTKKEGRKVSGKKECKNRGKVFIDRSSGGNQ